LSAKGIHLEDQLALGNSSLKEKTEECDGIRKLLVKFQEQKAQEDNLPGTRRSKTSQHISDTQKKIEIKFLELSNFQAPTINPPHQNQTMSLTWKITSGIPTEKFGNFENFRGTTEHHIWLRNGNKSDKNRN